VEDIFVTRGDDMAVTPIAVGRGLRELGLHASTWRKLQRLTTTQVAERAGISRDTLRSIEHGTGTASTENLLRVMRALGVLDAFVASVDPYTTDVGKLRANEVLPERVRGDR
jgi:transcriptional regulator with XRE-family HTH domain